MPGAEARNLNSDSTALVMTNFRLRGGKKAIHAAPHTTLCQPCIKRFLFWSHFHRDI